MLLVGALCALSACTVESSSERIYSLDVDYNATSPKMDAAIDADRALPQIALTPGFMGLEGLRLIALDPIGEVRNGIMLVADLRPHSKDMTSKLANVPGVESKSSIEITSRQGGEEMIRSLASHPVMLGDVRFDCRSDTFAYLSYHTADTFHGHAAYSFKVVGTPKENKMSGNMRTVACKGKPEGLAAPTI